MLPPALNPLTAETASGAEPTRQVSGSPEDSTGGSSVPAWRRLDEPVALVLLLLFCLSWVTLLKPDFDPDIWARLAVGKLVVESGGVTTHDPFAYTPKRPEWIDHEWGAGVIFYLVASLGGQKALLILKALLIFGTVLFVYLRARRSTGRPPSLIFPLLIVGAVHLGFALSVRSQVFTYFLFSAWLYILERARDGDWNVVWWIPISAVFWANVHGGFLAGIGLIVLFAGGAFIERGPFMRFVVVAAIASLGSLVNPYGLKYWGYLLDATTMDRSSIPEWGPLDLFGTQPAYLGFKVLLTLTVASVMTAALKGRFSDPGRMTTLAALAILGVRVSRHSTFFVIASAPFVWSWLVSLWTGFVAAGTRSGGWLARFTPTIARRYGHLGRGLLLAGTVLTLSTSPMRVVFPNFVPVRAFDFLAQNNLCRDLLVHFNFGSYAIWRLYPNCRVAVDGRYETVYLESTYRAVSNFFQGQPGWSEFLDAYPHDTILLSPRRPAVEKNMASRRDWQVAYEDEKSRVYVRGRDVNVLPHVGPADGNDPFNTSNKGRYVP